MTTSETIQNQLNNQNIRKGQKKNMFFISFRGDLKVVKVIL